jgi:hypothetical protein
MPLGASRRRCAAVLRPEQRREQPSALRWIAFEFPHAAEVRVEFLRLSSPTPWHDCQMVRVALGVALVGLLVGCGNAQPTERWFVLTEPYEPRGDFEASVLVRVDPQTLQPLRSRGLRLGDYVTSRVVSRDRRTLAFGGANDGELLFVDLSHPRVVRRLRVAPLVGGVGDSVDVIGWPRRARLLAVATPNTAWSAPHPSRLLLVDPEQRRVLRRTPLRDGMIASVSLRDGTVALLGAVKRFPTLLALRPDGSTWATRLHRLDLGGHDGVTLGGGYYPPDRMPALATDGKRLFVVASDRPVAEILPRTRVVRYHRVPLRRRYLSHPPAVEPGSGGVNLRFATSAAFLGNGQLAIGGADELPSWVRGYGAGHRLLDRLLQIVDTRRWRPVRAVPATSCEATDGVTLCHAVTSGFAPDGKGARGASLVAYDMHWHRLYEKRSSELWWEMTAGRLLAGGADGSRMTELDPATGDLLRKIKPAPLANDMWPFDLIRWTPPH